MKLLANIRNWLEKRNSALPVAQRAMSLGQAWLRGREEDLSGGPKLVNALQQSAWVYGCVTAMGEQVGDIPFVFSRGRRGGEERVEEGPVVELFNQPDPMMDRFMFWNLVCQWLLLRGKCYIIALDAAGGIIPFVSHFAKCGTTPARLVLLNPDRVKLLRAGREFVGYQYQSGANDVMGNQGFLPEEVISIRMPYACDYLEGLPPLGVALLAAETDYASAQLMKGLVLNNADSGLIVTTSEALTVEQQAQVMAALRERKRAAGTADRPLFLTDKCKVQTPPLALADMEFLENRKFNRQEICAIFRVPQEVLGYTEDANRAVAESVRLSFIENRVVPFCRRLEAAVEPVVKLFGSDLWGWFDWESLPVMQEARRTRYQTAREGFEMGIPLNVLNQVFDLGLPRLAHGDVSYLAGNLREVGTTESKKVEGRIKKGEVERLEELLGLVEKRGEGRGEKGDAETRRKMELVKGLEGKFSRFFFEQRKRTLSRMQNAECRMTNGEKFFDLRSEDQFLVDDLGPVLAEMFDDCVRELQKEFPEFEMEAGERAAFLEEREVALRQVNEETAAALKSADGVRGVKEVFQAAGDCRARELAEKEVSLAWGFVRSLGVLASHNEGSHI